MSDNLDRDRRFGADFSRFWTLASFFSAVGGRSENHYILLAASGFYHENGRIKCTGCGFQADVSDCTKTLGYASVFVRHNSRHSNCRNAIIVGRVISSESSVKFSSLRPVLDISEIELQITTNLNLNEKTDLLSNEYSRLALLDNQRSENRLVQMEDGIYNCVCCDSDVLGKSRVDAEMVHGIFTDCPYAQRNLRVYTFETRIEGDFYKFLDATVYFKPFAAIIDEQLIEIKFSFDTTSRLVTKCVRTIQSGSLVSLALNKMLESSRSDQNLRENTTHETLNGRLSFDREVHLIISIKAQILGLNEEQSNRIREIPGFPTRANLWMGILVSSIVETNFFCRLVRLLEEIGLSRLADYLRRGISTDNFTDSEIGDFLKSGATGFALELSFTPEVIEEYALLEYTRTGTLPEDRVSLLEGLQTLLSTSHTYPEPLYRPDSEVLPECVVCSSETARMMAMGCGHIYGCENCSTLVDKCPMCRIVNRAYMTVNPTNPDLNH